MDTLPPGPTGPGPPYRTAMYPVRDLGRTPYRAGPNPAVPDLGRTRLGRT